MTGSRIEVRAVTAPCPLRRHNSYATAALTFMSSIESLVISSIESLVSSMSFPGRVREGGVLGISFSGPPASRHRLARVGGGARGEEGANPRWFPALNPNRSGAVNTKTTHKNDYWNLLFRPTRVPPSGQGVRTKYLQNGQITSTCGHAKAGEN